MNRTRRRVGLDVKHEGREPRLTAADMLACARLAEQQGFDSFWTNEDIGYDSIAVLSSIAPQTRSIGLGTAIVNVYNRSALQIAMGIATLDELAGGRATLGLSVGHHPWNDLGHGIPLEAPLARLREYVAFIRKALSGQAFTHEGRFFQGVDTRLAFDPVRDAVPIYIGGERSGMVKLAGEVADGLILNVVTADYVSSFAADHFRSSARAAGRDADALELMAIVTTCVAADRDEALTHARATFMSRLAVNPTKMLATQPEHHEELAYLADMIAEGRRDQAQQEASEALVTSLIAAGTPSEVWASIDRYFVAGCTRVVIAPFPRGRAPAEAVLCALAPGL
jgi:alkanesulfonate monooxygenase SsuD/methylene tetrahydromethanopterin reductase-like flavin-dependent oxidoreductase (luciferase family)